MNTSIDRPRFHQRSKLLDSIYFKNMRKRELSLHESNKLNTQNESYMYRNNLDLSQTRIKIDIIHNPDFGVRNFARLCDKSLLALSSFHESQKFGPRVLKVKLPPLQKQLSIGFQKQNVKTIDTLLNQIQIQSYAELKQPFTKLSEPLLLAPKIAHPPPPKLDNQHRLYKRLLRPRDGHKGILFIFKSFVITEHKDINQKVNLQLKKNAYTLSFDELERILSLPNLEEILRCLQENLQVVENGKIKLRTQAIEKIPLNRDISIELPKRLFIENKRDKGYFLVEFPRVELYKPEFSYTQKLTLNSKNVFEFLRLNFANRDNYLQYFDKQKCQEHVEKLKIDRQNNKGVSLDAEENIHVGLSNEHTQEGEEIQHPNIITKDLVIENPDIDSLDEERKDLLAIYVKDLPNLQDHENNWSKKILKQTIDHNQNRFIVTFCSPKIIVRERISDKVVKCYFSTFEEFSSLIHYTVENDLSHFCQTMIKIESNLDEMELDINAFREKLQIIPQWPNTGEPWFIEAGEPNIENGLFKIHEKVIEINNKHFVIQLWPPTLELYDYHQQQSYRKPVTTEFLNEVQKRKFLCQLDII